MFRETTKEDAISYRDWQSEIEDALQRDHDATKVKKAMFASLEGMARDNAKMIDENGDLHITCILDGLDSLYGVSMTFQSLNAALVRPAAETNGIHPRLVQLHDTDNGHPKRVPQKPLQARNQPFGPTEGAVGAGGEQCLYTYTVPHHPPLPD